MKPIDIAKKICQAFTEHVLVKNIGAAAPGFINIFLNKNYAMKSLTNLIFDGVKPPTLDEKLRILVDFSSPNIAKEMHVGHLRYVQYCYLLI